MGFIYKLLVILRLSPPPLLFFFFVLHFFVCVSPVFSFPHPWFLCMWKYLCHCVSVSCSMFFGRCWACFPSPLSSHSLVSPFMLSSSVFDLFVVVVPPSPCCFEFNTVAHAECSTASSCLPFMFVFSFLFALRCLLVCACVRRVMYASLGVCEAGGGVEMISEGVQSFRKEVCLESIWQFHLANFRCFFVGNEVLSLFFCRFFAFSLFFA